MQVDIQGLSFKYDGEAQPALVEVDCRLNPGERICVIGASGSGKSTLLMLLTGLLPVKSGRINYRGQPAGKAGQRWLRAQVGYAMQQPERQLYCPTAWAEVMQGPHNLGWPTQKAEVAVASALRRLGLDVARARRHSPFQYSGSEQRMICLAGTIATQPRLLVLDEPTAGLDMPAARRVLEAISTAGTPDSITVLATHNLEVALRFGTRVLVLCRGRLVLDAHPDFLFSSYSTLPACGLAASPLNQLAAALHQGGWHVPAGRRWEPAALAELLASQWQER